ncbi:XRE family transcriptional regulator [Mesorhizobium sp.]|uniref:XRE family transcriptional regulator n=1 Tax=Mesorhizobium sp. TaxID=1871066 RepID=UPI000FE7A564|nr:XRE family transcriptional regulator [Mesorhizobium sp.]RWC25481.1 MAG: helix-turn-helix domain-containing protein [Mesorhizobium sp.]TIX23523.1 MAG: helix-turn-helix domain-containing protein [Mesorhizobium sp.]
MRVGTPGFVPARLLEARAARRIKTQKKLAEALGVVSSTVSRWENGDIAPDADAISALADHLGVRREFFLRPVIESGRPMFHRQLSNTLVADIRYQHSQMSWLQEISSILQHYVDFPSIDIPDVLGGASWKQLREEDIEHIALELRRHWRIGDGPCGDIVALLERIGIIVGTIEMGTSRLDGLCNWSVGEERPHVLLATDKMSFPRRQMDGAHELAHAVLHRNVTSEELAGNLKEIETQAFRLASAFLMPSTSYPHEVRRPSLSSFLSLKERWRVSIKAQIHRLADLEIIPSEYVVDLYKLHSAKGWTREEPLDREWQLSEPRLLRDALNLIVSSGVRTKDDLLAVEFTMSPEDIERLGCLTRGWFVEKEGKLVQLRVSETPQAARVGGAGTVIPFYRR